MSKKKIDEIFETVNDVVNKEGAKVLRNGIISTLEISYPFVGAVVGTVNDLLSGYNTLKLNWLLKGLSDGSNVDESLNKLYKYVNLTNESAMEVANLFRKTINAECPKLCVIYGLILANHIDTERRFSREELIICRALENATEYDLVIFGDLMEKFLKRNFGKTKIVFPQHFDKADEYKITCDWCVYNRIFELDVLSFGDMEVKETCYSVSNAAFSLMEYIKIARGLWNI